jgi:hypothetical protein
LLAQIQADRDMREKAVANQNTVNAAIAKALMAYRGEQAKAGGQVEAYRLHALPELEKANLERSKWDFQSAQEPEVEKWKRYYMNQGMPEDQAYQTARELVSPSPAPKAAPPERPQQPNSAEQMRLEALARDIRANNPKMSEAEVTARAYAQLGFARRAMSGNPGIRPQQATVPAPPIRQGSMNISEGGAYRPMPSANYINPNSVMGQQYQEAGVYPNPVTNKWTLPDTRTSIDTGGFNRPQLSQPSPNPPRVMPKPGEEIPFEQSLLYMLFGKPQYREGEFGSIDISDMMRGT